MRNLGGVSCSEEFAAFLGANPTFAEIEDPGPGGLTQYKQIYICLDGGVRFYEMPEPSRLEQVMGFLSANPTFGGLTPLGLLEYAGISGNPVGISLFAPGSGFYLYNYIDEFEYYVVFDREIVSPSNLAIIDANPSWLLT